MTPKRNLSLLFSMFQHRNDRLRSRLTDLRLRSHIEVDALITSVVIDAQGAWQTYLRAYYLSTIYGAKFRNRPVNTVAGLPNAEAALRTAYRVYYGKEFTKSNFTKRDDPPWHDLQFYKRLFADVGASNTTEVISAFAYSGLFLSMLPTARNFYAHRCDETLNRLTTLSSRVGFVATGRVHPTEVFRYEIPGRNMIVLRDWLFDMDNVADLMCN